MSDGGIYHIFYLEPKAKGGIQYTVFSADADLVKWALERYKTYESLSWSLAERRLRIVRGGQLVYATFGKSAEGYSIILHPF